MDKRIATLLYRSTAILICFILLSCFSPKAVTAEEGAKDLEIVESAVDFNRNEFPYGAYLCMELKNKSDRDIANANFEIVYYDTDDYLMKRTVLKNKLPEPIPRGETRRFKMHLKGRVMNERNEEYPYSQSDEVGEFDVKVLSVKFGRK
ncbi:MAG: hypothetical protein PHX20_02410 [Candidatus Omnitrophica bacterium]|nr:hypothetical protein [Candidatus Omnitrophota bacterium]MDD5436374.1 hypothetical protein [Candidatus Omnitrophota bacterium]